MTKIIFAIVTVATILSLSGCYTQLASTKPESHEAYASQSSSQTYSDAVSYVGSDTLQQGGTTINNYYVVPRYSRFIYPYSYYDYYNDVYYDPFYGPVLAIGFGWGGYPYPYSYYRPWYGGYYPHYPVVAYGGYYGPRGTGWIRGRDGYGMRPAIYPKASSLTPATMIRTRNDNAVTQPNVSSPQQNAQRPSGRVRSGNVRQSQSRAVVPGATRGGSGGGSGRKVESRPAPSGGGRQSQSHGEGGRTR
jgi:hypothetical protein